MFRLSPIILRLAILIKIKLLFNIFQFLKKFNFQFNTIKSFLIINLSVFVYKIKEYY